MIKQYKRNTTGVCTLLHTTILLHPPFLPTTNCRIILVLSLCLAQDQPITQILAHSYTDKDRNDDIPVEVHRKQHQDIRHAKDSRVQYGSDGLLNRSSSTTSFEGCGAELSDGVCIVFLCQAAKGFESDGEEEDTYHRGGEHSSGLDVPCGGKETWCQSSNGSSGAEGDLHASIVVQFHSIYMSGFSI